VIVVVGLAFEARIAARTGFRVVCSGDGRNLAAVLSGAIIKARDSAEDCRGLISFGVAGGLAPELKAGTCIVGSEILSDAGSWMTDQTWSEKLLLSLPDAVHGAIFGAHAPVALPEAKRSLHVKTGAIAVDMESQVVARIAMQFGLPVAALRVITDPASRALPDSAVKAVRSNGTTDILAMSRFVLKRPGELIGLLRTARDAWVARSMLLRGRQSLNFAFGRIEHQELGCTEVKGKPTINAERYLSPSVLPVPEV
jgi:adenosylhomocysteine nucleosidase